MSKNLLLCIISISCLADNAIAGTMGPLTQENPIHWVGSFSIGPVWTMPTSQQTIFLTPEIEKTYTAYKPRHTLTDSNTLADGELFLGIKKDLPYNLFAHIGIAGALTSQASLSGEIEDDADPQFNNYVYGYHIQHAHVALKAKVELNAARNFPPQEIVTLSNFF